MVYVLQVSPPEKLKSKILDVSQRIVEDVYKKNVRNILYRVKSKAVDDDPLKLFVSGDGKILEFDLAPHCSLVKPFNSEVEKEEISNRIKEAVNGVHSFSTEIEGIGDHGESFTFFLKLSKRSEFLELETKLFQALHKYFPDRKHLEYTPHITLLYDDADYKSAKDARKKMGEDILLGESFIVDRFSLYKLEGVELVKLREFTLL
ncbi:MAG: 2'-5' RNA ligase family protein [Patescibacteria group bacterium]|nr:2'-5' RNA ligase family protein [Patescibacteria group bacterium]